MASQISKSGSAAGSRLPMGFSHSIAPSPENSGCLRMSMLGTTRLPSMKTEAMIARFYASTSRRLRPWSNNELRLVKKPTEIRLDSCTQLYKREPIFNISRLGATPASAGSFLSDFFLIIIRLIKFKQTSLQTLPSHCNYRMV